MGSAAAASGAGPGVMPAQVLGGPVWWLIFGIYLLTIAFALFTLADALRPKRAERFAQIREPRWLYAGFAAIYLVCVLGAWIPALPRVLTVIPVALAIPMLVVGFAYLLRVVFPKPAVEPAELAPSAPNAGTSDRDADS